MLTKDAIQNGVFTCLIKMNCNRQPKRGFGSSKKDCFNRKTAFEDLVTRKCYFPHFSSGFYLLDYLQFKSNGFTVLLPLTF